MVPFLLPDVHIEARAICQDRFQVGGNVCQPFPLPLNRFVYQLGTLFRNSEYMSMRP